MDVEDGVGDRGLLGWCCVAVVRTQGALLEDGFADEPPGEQDDALAAGKRADPDQVGDGLEPVCFGEEARRGGRGDRASWDQPWATCQAARPSASRENEERHVTAG